MRKEIIGNCTLYLGDCMEIMPTLGKVDAVVTDPPYGMSYVSAKRKQRYDAIKGDNTSYALVWACSIIAAHSKYIFHRWDNLSEIPQPRSLIVWVKNNWGSGDLNGEHARSTEYISFYRGEDHYFPMGRPTDVLRHAKSSNKLHPTQKPISLMQEIIGWTAGTVVDPFMGSGTTGVACAKMGRKFIGIELDPDYFEIACKRIEEAYKQPDLFVETKVEKPEQNKMDI